jgi:hypothetical protein
MAAKASNRLSDAPIELCNPEAYFKAEEMGV